MFISVFFTDLKLAFSKSGPLVGELIGRPKTNWSIWGVPELKSLRGSPISLLGSPNSESPPLLFGGFAEKLEGHQLEESLPIRRTDAPHMLQVGDAPGELVALQAAVDVHAARGASTRHWLADSLGVWGIHGLGDLGWNEVLGSPHWLGS